MYMGLLAADKSYIKRIRWWWWAAADRLYSGCACDDSTAKATYAAIVAPPTSPLRFTFYTSNFAFSVLDTWQLKRFDSSFTFYDGFKSGIDLRVFQPRCRIKKPILQYKV